MSSTEFYKVRERVISRFYNERHKFLYGTVDSGSDADTLVDADAAISGATADKFDYGYIKIRQTTDNLAPQGEVRAIDEGGYTASTGTFETVAFTASLTAGDNYEIHPEFRPNQIDDTANRKLRELHMPSLFPLTLDIGTSNNDFEAAQASANEFVDWTKDGSPTGAIETTIIYNGTRSAKVTHTTAADDRYSRTFFVDSGKQYYSAIVAACDSGDTARFVVRDATNSATIDDASTTRQAMQELIVPWTAPATCRNVQIRLTGDANGDKTYWDDYQTWAQGGYIYPLPSWITRKEQLIDIVEYPAGTAGPVGDYDYRTNENRGRKLTWRFERADTRATNELFVYVNNCGEARPYIVAYRPLDEVSFDYGTAGVGAGALGSPANTIPLSTTETDALVAGVLAEMYRMKAEGLSVGEMRTKYERAAQRYERIWIDGTWHLRPEGRVVQRQSDRAYGTVA